MEVFFTNVVGIVITAISTLVEITATFLLYILREVPSIANPTI